MASALEAREHISSDHPGIAGPENIDLMLNRIEISKSRIAATPCPLCSEDLDSVKGYARHVGRHQKDLALFSLPRLDVDEGSEADKELPGQANKMDHDSSDVEQDSGLESEEMEAAAYEDTEFGHFPYHSSNNGPAIDPGFGLDTGMDAGDDGDPQDSFPYLSTSSGAAFEDPSSTSHTNVTNAQSLTCEQCQKVFRRPADLRKHWKNHQRAFSCPNQNCMAKFDQKRDLDRHMWTQHGQTYPSSYYSSCEFPDCKFSGRRDNVARHMRTSHGTTPRKNRKDEKVVGKPL